MIQAKAKETFNHLQSCGPSVPFILKLTQLSTLLVFLVWLSYQSCQLVEGARLAVAQMMQGGSL